MNTHNFLSPKKGYFSGGPSCTVGRRREEDGGARAHVEPPQLLQLHGLSAAGAPAQVDPDVAGGACRGALVDAHAGLVPGGGGVHAGRGEASYYLRRLEVHPSGEKENSAIQEEIFLRIVSK